jgi:D-inositol-3-phosphate glycosyltransferase
MQPLKGLDLLLEALALLSDRHGYQLLAVGGNLEGDPELSRLHALATRLGVADRVSFLGAQPQQRLSLYYSAADVCVVPSHYESFGLVAMEALACGTPVIASRVGGLPTVIRDGENGLLVTRRSAEAFAGSIDHALSDQGLLDRLTHAARPSVQRLTWGAVADQLLAVYDELASAKPPAQACLCAR